MTIGETGGVTTGYLGATAKTGTTTSSTSGATSTMASQLSTPDLFIKMLMAELEHEDPTNPTTPSSILQQTSELSQVESITTMTTALDQQRRYAEAGDATGLIGREVTAVVTGIAVSGTVSQVSLSSTGTPMLEISGAIVPLGSVIDVTGATTALGAASALGTSTAALDAAATTPVLGTATSTSAASATATPASAPMT